MAGGGEAAKSALESAFNKTKEVLNSAAESTKELANVAFENVSKIIPGQNTASNANPPAEGVTVTTPDVPTMKH